MNNLDNKSLEDKLKKIFDKYTKEHIDYLNENKDVAQKEFNELVNIMHSNESQFITEDTSNKPFKNIDSLIKLINLQKDLLKIFNDNHVYDNINRDLETILENLEKEREEKLNKKYLKYKLKYLSFKKKYLK